MSVISLLYTLLLCERLSAFVWEFVKGYSFLPDGEDYPGLLAHVRGARLEVKDQAEFPLFIFYCSHLHPESQGGEDMILKKATIRPSPSPFRFYTKLLNQTHSQ